MEKKYFLAGFLKLKLKSLFPPVQMAKKYESYNLDFKFHLLNATDS